MLEMGKTRFGTAILLRWREDENGGKVVLYQVFATGAELFDAVAVYALIAARMPENRQGSEFSPLIFESARYYAVKLAGLKNADALAEEIQIRSAFDRARYAENLVNIAFK